MRRFIPIIAAFIISAAVPSWGKEAHSMQVDSTSMAALSEKLEEYLGAIQTEPAEVKCREADFIIGTCKDSSVRQAVTVMVYRHFITSPVMGDETVAIHVFDKWIADGPVQMYSMSDYWAASLFAQVNRRSLTGCRTPSIELKTPDGRPFTVFGAGMTDGAYSILYFYDTDCTKCRVETMLLRNMLENDGFNATLYAIYIGTDKAAWEEYRQSALESDSPDISIVHLWDPDRKSNMEMLYGVLQTPSMFLVSPDGTIIGRRLDTEALEKLLAAVSRPEVLDYGGDRAMEIFDMTFASMGEDAECDAVDRVARHIESRTLHMGDTLLYRQMTGDLLYYLTGRREEAFKCGTPGFVDRYILSRHDIWSSPDDTLKVVELAEMLSRLDSLCPAGSRLPDLKVPVTIVRTGKSREIAQTKKLSALRNSAVIFHTEGCPVCWSEIQSARSMLSSGEITIERIPGDEDSGHVSMRTAVLVDMDRIWSTDPELAEELMGEFDLSSLPFILCTDSKGKVTRKYISLARLQTDTNTYDENSIL